MRSWSADRHRLPPPAMPHAADESDAEATQDPPESHTIIQRVNRTACRRKTAQEGSSFRGRKELPFYRRYEAHRKSLREFPEAFINSKLSFPKAQIRRAFCKAGQRCQPQPRKQPLSRSAERCYGCRRCSGFYRRYRRSRRYRHSCRNRRR